MDIIVAILGAGGALFIFKYLASKNDTRHQAELERQVAEISRQVKAERAEIESAEKQTKEKVDAITSEQNRPVNSSDLVDFFNQRKK